MGFYIVVMLISVNVQAQCLNEIDIQTSAVGCEPGAVGSATITPLNGLPPYTYTMPGNVVTQSTPLTIPDLLVGHYSIQIKDSNSCQINTGFDIGEHNLFIDDIETTIANCTPNDLGEALFIIENGDLPFTYEWPGGNMVVQNGSVHTITDLSTGTYSVTVTDVNGCQDIEAFTIEEDEMILQLYDVELCGTDCAQMDAGFDNICFPVTWEWFNSAGVLIANGPVPTICAPDTYICRLTSCNGCYREETFVISNNINVDYNLVEIINPGCNSTCDGSIDIEVTGGTGNLEYVWHKDDVFYSNDADLTDLCEGLYQLTITDDTGCSTPAAEFELNCTGFEVVPYIEQPACANECFGFVSVEIIGGQPPFNYSWSTGQNQPTVYNLCPGIYTVTVVDAVNHVETLDIEVVEQNPLHVDIVTTGATCSDGGTIDIVVTEGSGDYKYYYFGTEIFTTTLTDLPQGLHLIEVLDNGTSCNFEEFVNVDAPYDVIINSTPANCNMSDGTAMAEIPNGTSTYTFEWSNGATTSTITGLAIGGYSVTVTDTANNCESHENVIIEEDSECYVTISGFVYDDDSVSDCILDAGTDRAQFQLVGLDNNQFTFTDENGFYSFQTEPGTHEVTYETESQLFDPLCVDPITVTVPNFGDSSTDNNFFVEGLYYTDLQLYLSKTPIRPGFNHYVSANVFNFANETVTGSYTHTHDPNQIFIESEPPATSYDAVTRVITWDYTNLNPYETYLFRMKFTTDASLTIGTVIENTGEISTFATDFDPENNIKTCTRVVSGSYDPNDKEVQYPFEGWEPHTYLPGSLAELTYRIRFQNTGTDTAFTVIVEDELDYLIELRDIVPGPASHPYTISVRDGNVLQFNFNNILLPDSTTNEAASHGFVFFNVNLTDDVVEGDMIYNQAAIFFDYNTPIYTNEVETYFEYPVGVEEEAVKESISLQPNPTSGQTNFYFSLQSAQKVTIDLMDISGKVVTQILENELCSTGAHQILVNTSDLQNGTYIVRLTKDKELITRKLVVIK